MVERQLPKLDVASSTLVARSNLTPCGINSLDTADAVVEPSFTARSSRSGFVALDGFSRADVATLPRLYCDATRRRKPEFRVL